MELFAKIWRHNTHWASGAVGSPAHLKYLSSYLCLFCNVSLIHEVLAAPSLSLLSCNCSSFLILFFFKLHVLSHKFILRVQENQNVTHLLLLRSYITKINSKHHIAPFPNLSKTGHKLAKWIGKSVM
jgi:hypothetical protein